MGTHHFTNTTTSASYQHDFTVDTEEILNVEGGHGYGFKERFGRNQRPMERQKLAGLDKNRCRG